MQTFIQKIAKKVFAKRVPYHKIRGVQKVFGHPHFAVLRLYKAIYLIAIASISTRAPIGKAATW